MAVLILQFHRHNLQAETLGMWSPTVAWRRPSRHRPQCPLPRSRIRAREWGRTSRHNDHRFYIVAGLAY